MTDLDDLDWTGFADLATPEEMAEILIGMLGEHAGYAAAVNGLAADGDNRPEDKCYWAAVLQVIKRQQPIGSPPAGLSTHP